MALTAAQIRKSKSATPKVFPVNVPEWADPETGDDVVYVRVMAAFEKDAFEESCRETKGKKSTVKLANIRARLVVLCACDAKGARLFRDEEAHEVGEMDAPPIERIFQAAAKANRFNPEDVDELEKN